MITLRQIYTVFGHDDQFKRLAADCLQSMDAVYLRKIGDKDIMILSLQDIAEAEAQSRQPVERVAKAHSCMQHLLNWAKAHGKNIVTFESNKEIKGKDDCIEERQKDGDVYHNDDRRGGISPSAKRNTSGNGRVERHDNYGIGKAKRRSGVTYYDSSSKGINSCGKRVFKSCWRAEITIDGARYRHRSQERTDCEEWLNAIRTGKIKPTDNKADWWRMEQRKDEEARIDEMITSSAEEAHIVYEYRHSGDTEILFEYAIKRLLPHMIYYCAHTLRMGRERSLSASKQAIGLILTRIVGGRPITNLTYTCKHMLRINQQRGDFWFYEKAPNEVKMLVNRIDYTPLAELYKVVKDKRLS